MSKLDELTADFARAPVPDGRTTNGWRIAIIIIGVAITIPAFLVGAQIGNSVSITSASIVFFAAAAIVSVVGSFAGVVAAKTNLSTAMIIQFSFGTRGAYAVNTVIAVSLLGWFGVTTEVFADAIQASSADLFGTQLSREFYIVSGGLIMTLTAAIGFKALDSLSLIAVPVLLIFMLIVLLRTIDGMSGSFDADRQSTGALGIGTAISAAVGGFMVGVTMLPDMCRYAKSSGHAVIASVFGFGVGYPLVLFLAAVPAIATGNDDFVITVLGLGLGMVATIVVAFATWTSNANNLYSNSLALSAMLPSVPKWALALVSGALGTALGAIGIIEYFIEFLILLSTLIPPIAGIYISDFFLVKRQQYDVAAIDALPVISLPAFVAWTAGFVVALTTARNLMFITGIPGLDAIVVASITYWFLSKYRER